MPEEMMAPTTAKRGDGAQMRCGLCSRVAETVLCGIPVLYFRFTDSPSFVTAAGRPPFAHCLLKPLLICLLILFAS